MSDRAARQELATTIRWLASLHESSTNRQTSAEFVITALRDLGQHTEADQLEQLVSHIRAQRAAPL